MAAVESSTGEQKPAKHIPWWGWLLAAVLVYFILDAMFATPPNRRDLANKIKCASNLKQIGLAISMYAKNNGGQYPDQLKTLILSEDLYLGAFICPGSNDTQIPSTMPTDLAAFSSGGHLSYFYVGQNLNTKTTSPLTVVAYESIANHKGDGGNILYGDGHVNWVEKSDPVWATLPKH